MIVIHLQPFLNIDSLNQVDLLSATISNAMINDQDIIFRTDEGFSFDKNGFYSVLNNLCFYWGYDGRRITIETNNWKEQHAVYNVKPSAFSTDFTDLHVPKTSVNWNKEKVYGLFVGRTSIERLYGIIKHRHFSFSSQGLSSFNHSIKFLDFREVTDLIENKNLSADEILNIQPYSDIDSLRTPPITAPYNSSPMIWKKIYEKIAIELIFETNQFESSFQITEKTLRPIAYKRPFIIVAPAGYYTNLRNFGFKTFDNIILDWYDNFSGLTKVDNAFIVLERLFKNNLVDNLLNLCSNDIEHNYNRLLELINQHKDQQSKNKNYYNFSISKIKF